MITEELSIFSIPLYKIKIDQWSLKKKAILGLPEWDDPECLRGDNYTDYHKYRDNPPYKYQFITMIFSELTNFSNDMGFDLDVKALWAQRYKNSQFMPPHNHGALGLSAVLFAEFDAQDHSSTSFISPFPNFIDGHLLIHEPEVEEGDLILFPSYLQHCAMPNESEKQRTIFSFNMSVT